MSNSFFSLLWTRTLGAQSLLRKVHKSEEGLEKKILGFVQDQHRILEHCTNRVIFYQLLLAQHEMLILVSRALS